MMRSGAPLLLLVGVSLLAAVLKPGWCLKNGDCLKPESSSYFQLSPGGYNPDKGIDGVRCRALCASISAPYSGVQGKKYCLCSDDPFAERLTATKKAVCDQGEQFSTRFFHSDLFTPIEGLRVIPSSSVVNVGEEVSFHLTATSGKNATVAFNFGDGGDGTRGNLKSEPKYVYWKPGTYSVVVLATPQGASDLFTVRAQTMVVVTTAPDEDSVSWHCPELVEPGTGFTCYLSVRAGSDMLADIDPGDGTRRYTVTVPDVVPYTLGERVPQFKTPNVILDEDDNADSAVLPNTRVTHSANMTTVLGYGSVAGKLDLLILRPTCQGCSSLGNNVTCPDGEYLCSQEVSCLRSDQCPKRNVYSIYKVIETVSIVVVKGYFVFQLPNPIAVVPGDILGFTTSGGRLAYRRTLNGEQADLIKRNVLKGQAVRTDDLLENEQRFYIGALLYTAVNLTYDYKYLVPGAYEFRVGVRNKHHDTLVRKMADVSSQEKLTAFRLDVSRNQVPTGTEVEIIARMFGGSDITMVWSFGDGHTTTQIVKTVTMGEKFYKTHIFNEPGQYVVQVNSSNLHGNFVARRGISVQRPVTEAWELFTNSPVILPDAVYLTLTYPKTEKLPTDAMARVEFGDKQKAKWRVPNESPEKVTQKFTHVYHKPGFYQVSINISNLISSYILNAKIETATRTTGLVAKVQFQPTDDAPFQSGLGSTNDIFPTTRPVTFFVKTATGVVEQYIIETAKGRLLTNGTGKQLRYTLNFPEAGQHDIFVYAWNHVQQRTDPFVVSFRTMEPIEGLEVYMNETTPKTEHIRNFMVSFDLAGTDTCVIVDYGDETLRRAYGSRSQCFTRYRPEQFQHEGDLENPLWLQNIYGRGEDYVFSLVAFNDISEASSVFNFTVNDEPCKPPIIKIRNQVLDPINATVFYRLRAVELYTLTLVECNISIDVTRAWQAFQLNDTGGTMRELDLTPLDSRTKSMLYVPEFFFDPGIYRLRYNVNMSAPRARPPFYHRRFAETYIEMKPSPLLPQMAEGAQSRVTRGFPQTLTLNPGNYSINPDDPSDKNFTVTWFCRRVPGEVINRTVSDEEQNVTQPLYHRLELLDNITAQGHDFDVQGFLAKEEMEDLGGCFGSGPGRVNITGGALEWSTILFYKPNATYEVLAKIEKDDRPPSWGAVQVVLMEKVPPSISVRCQTEKLCYPNDPIGQKINPVRVGLIGLCIENCEGEMVYSWEVFGSDNDTEVFLEDARDFLVGAAEQKMALSDDFFKVYYPMFGDFVARLTVTNQWGVTGVSDLFLHINKPPENGNCQFEPEEGMALMDKFKASCSDWTDPEGIEIEFFAFWVRNIENEALTFLMYGPDSEVTLILPYGEFQVGADIKDKEGATTRVNITTISTILPTKQDFERYLNDRSLDNADAAGDQARMNQMSQAISSLMNVRLPDEFENEINYSDPDVLDREMEEQALLRAKMVRSVSSIMNVDTLSSLEQVGSALTAIAGDGSGVDNEGKDIIIRLLQKTVKLASNLKVEAPQQLLDFCMYAVGTMGGIVARMTQQLIQGVVMPTDRAKAVNIEYDTEIALEGEPEKESLFDGTVPMDVALARAVVLRERQFAEKQITTMVQLTIDLVLAILRNIIVGEKPLEFLAPSGLGLTISMFSGGALSGRGIQHGDAVYIFPDVCDILASQPSCAGNETLGVMAVSWPSILQSFGGSVDVLSNDTKTLQLVVLDENLFPIDVSNTTNYFEIIVPRKGGSEDGTGLPEPTEFAPTIKWNEEMVYHQFVVPKPDSAVNIEITPHDPSAQFLVYIRHREKPQLNAYDVMVNLSTIRSTNGTYDIFMDNSMVDNRTGFFYLGIVQPNGTVPEFDMDEPVNLTASEVSREFTSNYSVRIYTSGCYFFHSQKKIWSAEGCFVANANYALTRCKCNHLTSFGSGFFVMPNTIDFSYVFANAGFADNVTIYMTVIVTLFIYLLVLIWARYEDKKDVEKLGASPLQDNDPRDKYIYEITVFTGEKENAATDSNVFFILSGDDDETEVRTFGDQKRKIFRRGASDVFVMTAPRSLGRLNYMRVWHDNSGKGSMRSWYLRFISVRDVQTNARYDFIANRWFAVEKEDGMTDRLLPVAGKDEATEFNHLFKLKSQKNLADGHLWFSVFMRPPKSRFTRCQRVSCCVALLYLSMLVNAMWYGRVPSKPSASAVNFGPFSLSPEQVGVGILANLIVFPPTFLMITLFRKSRLRTKRPNRITEALKQKRDSVVVSRASSAQPLVRNQAKTESTMALTKDMSDVFDENITRTRRQLRVKKKKSKFMFPWWCRYVAWFLCLTSIFVSIFIIWAYGVQFGDEKTRKWITSLLVSFFMSVLVTQPIKVFLLAIIFSALFKSPDKDDDDGDDDEEQPELPDNEEWLHQGTENTQGGRRKRLYKPPTSAELERLRDERMREIKMSTVIREIGSYLLFLWLLTVLSYGNRDPSAYFMQQNLHKQFVENGNFLEITSPDQFWKWAREVLVPNVKVGPWYNGQQPFGLRGFLADRVNRIMGFASLRQVRAKPNSCRVEKLMRNIVDSCRGQAGLLNIDKQSYLPGWQETVPDDVKNDKSKIDEWHYRRAKDLDGLPFWGKLDVYGGGGFLVPLRGSNDKIIQKLNELEKSDWIDGGTRAVFAEFSVYNAQVNLFGVVTIVAEFHPGGGIVANSRIDPIRLMRYHQGFGLFVLLCEISFIGFIIYFSVREFKSFLNLRMDYFRSYWNLAELVALGLSYAGMFFYISRMIVTNKILKTFSRSHGNGYVKLQVVAAIDEVFGYIMSFLIFICILKFTKLLRFNKRIGILYSTLAQCSRDLSSFFVVFWVVFFAFVQVFYVVLGSLMAEFSTFITAAETSFDMMRGQFKFEDIAMASPYIGPFVFFVFALVTSVILLNLFVTLIISSFQSVKEDIEKQCNDFEIVQFMGKKIKGFLGMGSANLDPEAQAPTLDQQITNFPEKVDRLLYYINDVYFGGTLNLDGKKALRALYKAPEQASRQTAPQSTMLDWMEVSEPQGQEEPEESLPRRRRRRY
ncbi:uncharacterized protein LOC135392080 [Ornithodoros turicata]|uniref:uncharacterized protein LOC135392080 n=1 Tax=Ornithodoros turicata TaxID=34597 RepID=UPI003139451F